MKIVITESQYQRILNLTEYNKITKDEFIKRAEEKHGKGRYYYGKVKFIDADTKVEIVCTKKEKNGKKHGSFFQTPKKHYSGGGCHKCANYTRGLQRRGSNEEFIKTAEKKHGKGRYDYSEVEYVLTTIPVKIICHRKYDGSNKEHGYFYQKPVHHLIGNGCPICALDIIRDGKLLTKNDFIKESEKKHGKGRYNYDKLDYKGYKKPVIIGCNKKFSNGNTHGFFSIPAGKHLGNKFGGCKICALQSRSEIIKERMKKVFKERAEKAHPNNRYDYSLVDFVNVKTHVDVICHRKNRMGYEHGVFPISPDNLWRGKGCPKCSESTGEKTIQEILDKKGIKIVREKTFDDCKSKFRQRDGKRYKVCRKLQFDFYLLNKNVLIEFDGYFHFNIAFGKENYENTIVNDRLKNEFVKNNPSLRLIRIAHTDQDNLKEELENGLKSTDKIYLSKNYPKNSGWRSNIKIKFGGEIYQ